MLSKQSNQTLSRRSFLKAMGIGAAALAVGACAPAAPAPAAPAVTPAKQAIELGEVTLTLSSWWNKPFRELMPQFSEKYPNIKVEFIDEEFGAHHEKLLTTLVAGTGAADIVGIEDSRLPMMADTGGLADLTEYMTLYKDKIVPYKLHLATYQGKIYSVPWDGSPCLLYYRRDICEQYEIDPEQIVTYDDWLEAGEKLKKATDGQVKLWNIGKDSSFPLINWTWQQGGGLYDLDGTKVIIDGPKGVRTLEFIKRLWGAGVVHQNLPWDAWNATYKDGTSVLFPGAIWLANIIKGIAPETSGKWGVVRVPAWEKDGSQAMTWGGSQLAIPAQGKHIAEAFKFLEFTQLTQEGQEMLWKVGDLFPVLIEAKDWPIMNEPVEFYGGQSALKLYAEVNAEVLPYTYGKGWLEAERIVGLQVAEVLDGRKTPEQALADAAKEIREKQKLS
jgi:lactose/L-arabinose transport system substrate-binding protein